MSYFHFLIEVNVFFYIVSMFSVLIMPVEVNDIPSLNNYLSFYFLLALFCSLSRIFLAKGSLLY